jgi:hypothetical protein
MAGQRLGQAWLIPIASAAITAGAAAYGSYTQGQIAKDVKDAAEERAAADRARADAEKAKADAELKKLTQPAVSTDRILGIPKEYVLYGGLGIGAIVVVGIVIALAK